MAQTGNACGDGSGGIGIVPERYGALHDALEAGFLNG